MKYFLVPIILTIAAIIQISFLNPSSAGINLILVLAVAFTLKYNPNFTLPGVWLAGMISDTNKTSVWGIGALALLCVVIFTVVGSRFFLSGKKIKNILAIGALAVILYRALFVAFLNLFAALSGSGIFEPVGIHFLTWGFLTELIVTPILILGILELPLNEKTQTLKFSN